MDINTLKNSIRDALATDAAIKAWCQAAYSKDHTVYVNADSDNLPGQDDCPYLIFWPEAKILGRAVSDKRHSFMIASCICDETLETGGEANVIEYKGVGRSEELRKLVETAMAGVGIGNALLGKIEVEYDLFSDFPFMMVWMMVEIGETWTIGSDILE